MVDLSKLKVGSTTYNIKDETARSSIATQSSQIASLDSTVAGHTSQISSLNSALHTSALLQLAQFTDTDTYHSLDVTDATFLVLQMSWGNGGRDTIVIPAKLVKISNEFIFHLKNDQLETSPYYGMGEINIGYNQVKMLNIRKGTSIGVVTCTIFKF